MVYSTIWQQAKIRPPAHPKAWHRDRDIDLALRHAYENAVGHPVRNIYESGTVAWEQWAYNPRSPRFRGRAVELASA